MTKEQRLALAEHDADRAGFWRNVNAITAAVLVLIWIGLELALRGESPMEARASMLLAIGGLTAGGAITGWMRRSAAAEVGRLEAARRDERAAVVRQLHEHRSGLIEVEAVHRKELTE